MQYKRIPVGHMQENAYVVYDENRDDCFVIDPGAEPEGILLELAGRRLAAILLTHGHYDHIGAVKALRGEDVPVFIHAEDAEMLTNKNLSLSVMFGGEDSQGEPDFCIEPGEMELCGVPIEVLHTKGHTQGSCCFRMGNVLFSGDTLFRRGIGRTDLPGGDGQALRKSLDALMELPDDIIVCPGHGGETTIGEEREVLS